MWNAESGCASTALGTARGDGVGGDFGVALGAGVDTTGFGADPACTTCCPTGEACDAEICAAAERDGGGAWLDGVLDDPGAPVGVALGVPIGGADPEVTGVGELEGGGVDALGVGVGLEVGHGSHNEMYSNELPPPSSMYSRPPMQIVIVSDGDTAADTDTDTDDAAAVLVAVVFAVTADSARPAGNATAAAQTPSTATARRPTACRPGTRPRAARDLLLPVRTLIPAPLVDRRAQFDPGADRNWLSGVESAWIRPW